MGREENGWSKCSILLNCWLPLDLCLWNGRPGWKVNFDLFCASFHVIFLPGWITNCCNWFCLSDHITIYFPGWITKSCNWFCLSDHKYLLSTVMVFSFNFGSDSSDQDQKKEGSLGDERPSDISWKKAEEIFLDDSHLCALGLNFSQWLWTPLMLSLSAKLPSYEQFELDGGTSINFVNSSIVCTLLKDAGFVQRILHIKYKSWKPQVQGWPESCPWDWTEWFGSRHIWGRSQGVGVQWGPDQVFTWLFNQTYKDPIETLLPYMCVTKTPRISEASIVHAPVKSFYVHWGPLESNIGIQF